MSTRADFDTIAGFLGMRAGVLKAPRPARRDPTGIVALASAHFVLPALSGPALSSGIPLPDDFAEFLSAVREANSARNATLTRALRDIGVALNIIGVIPLVLKGGAFLADAPDNDAAWRFMADLDLLVGEQQLAACVQAVLALGFTPATTNYSPQREAHYPPLISRCGTFSVELHTRLFAVHDIGPGTCRLMGDARPIELLGARLLLPSSSDRIAHLIAHAQIHNRFYATRRIVLRDMLDLTVLLDRYGCSIDWLGVLNCFTDLRSRNAALSFLAAWSALAGTCPPVEFAFRHHEWARLAIARLSRPLWQRQLLDVVDVVRLEAIRLTTERGHLARRMKLLSPGRFSHSYSAWRYKLGQKLWA